MGKGLSGGGAPGADDANVTMPLDEADVKQAGGGINAHDKLARFDFGMVWIRKNLGERIGEHNGGVRERNAVLA
jgi:hypothetical protein